MNWLDKQVSLYNSVKDITGRPATYRQVLLSHFGNYIQELNQLKQLSHEYIAGIINDEDYRVKKAGLKSKLPGFTPAALLATRAKENTIEIERSGMMQLDFDYPDIKDYDIEKLKQMVFNYPFTAFCSLSCSGIGFYALILIAEPERLSEYAEHIFNVCIKYGVKPDTGKGRKVNDLRFLSYDGNMLFRENPEPLKISQFKAKEPAKPVRQPNYPPRTFAGKDARITNGINELLIVKPGNRWETVKKIAYTLGGINGCGGGLNEINQAIESNQSFAGEEPKYLKCANHQFNEGLKKPF